MIIGDPLTQFFTPSRGKHQSGLDSPLSLRRENIFIKYFLFPRYFLFHLTQTGHASRDSAFVCLYQFYILGYIFDCIKSKGCFPHTTVYIMRSLQKQTIQSVLLKTSLVDEFVKDIRLFCCNS